MKLKKNIIFIIAFGVLLSQNVYALRPIDSLVLGNFEDKYEEKKSDPLEYVFNRDKELQEDKSLEEYKNNLAIYRGFYEEGRNLENSCKSIYKINYANEWDKIQNARMIMSELQYLGLDIAIRSIPQYAKYFEFTEEDFQNLVDNLVGNYCSQNISIISKKEIKNNLLLKFKKDNNFVLPSIKGNPLFPENLDKILSAKKQKELEFKSTVKIFQSMCSWSGDPTNPGLMTPFLKHSGIMAFVNRQLNSKKLNWKKEKNELSLVDDEKTIKVACDSLICRRTDNDNFKKKLLMGVGSTSYYQDFISMYCGYFSTVEAKTKELDVKLAKAYNADGKEEENFQLGQLSALLTGFPDLLFGLDKFSEGEELLRSSLDNYWGRWAKNQLKNFNQDLYFEEALTLELNDRKRFFNPIDKDLRLSFDVNLGEIDRINQEVGKLKVSFNLKLFNSYINFHRKAFENFDWNYPQEKERLINRLKLQIENDINFNRTRFMLPPWKGDLALLIAKELSEQILLKDEHFFVTDGGGYKNVKIDFNYSPFALRYINQMNLSKEKDLQDQKLKNKNK